MDEEIKRSSIMAKEIDQLREVYQTMYDKLVIMLDDKTLEEEDQFMALYYQMIEDEVTKFEHELLKHFEEEAE